MENNVKNKLLIISAVILSTLTGCKATLVPYSIKESHARVENYVETTKDKVKTHKKWRKESIDEEVYPYTKERLSLLFVMCHSKEARGYFPAYQIPAGPQKIWVKAVYAGREADVLFDINLSDGGDYGFGHELYDNRKQVDVWMKDLTTGKPITNRQVITLEPLKIDYQKSSRLWTQRCKQGTV